MIEKIDMLACIRMRSILKKNIQFKLGLKNNFTKNRKKFSIVEKKSIQIS